MLTPNLIVFHRYLSLTVVLNSLWCFQLFENPERKCLFPKKFRWEILWSKISSTPAFGKPAFALCIALILAFRWVFFNHDHFYNHDRIQFLQKWCPRWTMTVSSFYNDDRAIQGDRTENVLWRLQNGELDNLSPKVTIFFLLWDVKTFPRGDHCFFCLFYLGCENLLPRWQLFFVSFLWDVKTFPRGDHCFCLFSLGCENLPPEVIVVSAGQSNQGDSAEEIAEGLKEICAVIRSKQPQAFLVLLVSSLTFSDWNDYISISAGSIFLPQTLLPRGQLPNPLRERNAKVCFVVSEIQWLVGDLLHEWNGCLGEVDAFR